jgi:hypothetical protein
MIAVVVGSVGDFLALGYATQALVTATGGSVTLIGNVLIGYYLNGEDLYLTDMLGTVTRNVV